MPLIDDDEIVYFRDIYDHVIRLTDELDNYRELASATLDVYLTTINNNLSVIMKRLTGVTVILAGIGAVAGIFGMSEAGTALAGQRGRRVLGGHRHDRSSWRRRSPRSSCAGSTGSSRLHVTRSRPAWASGGRPRGRPPPARRLGDDLELAGRALGTLGGLEPELLLRRGEGVVEVELVAVGPRDLVQEPLVVARPDLDDHPEHLLAVLDLRRLEERQEHALAGVGVEVGGAALAGLSERADPHRDVAQRVVVAVARRDDRQVDVEGGDPDPRGDPVGRGARARRRADRARAAAA